MFRNARRPLVVVIALLLTALAPAIASASTATTYGPKAAPNGVGQPAWYRASEWNGAEPTWYGTTDWWIVSAPADPSPDLKRRSEIKVGTSQAAATISGVGKKTQWKGWLKPVLGPAANDGRSWHSLVQLHGPDTDGAWRYAQAAIRVEDGYWTLWGDNNDGTAWTVNVMPYVDNYATWAMITYRPGVDSSLVCLTLDPAASNGVDPPAVSTCHWAEPWASQWLVWHSGLYRGSGNLPFEQGGIQPTYEQHVFVKAPETTVYE